VPGAVEHWNDLNRRGDLSGVGQSSLPASMNSWLYRAKLRQLRRLVSRLQLEPRSVYDVGAGTGYWTEYWVSLGAEVAGCDFSAEAVARLQKLGHFELLDISNRSPAATCDLVWVADVLLHILDEDRFRQALANIATIVEPGGYLILLEPAQVASFRTVARDAYSLARPVESYLQPLRSAGLSVVEVVPATAVANNPIEGSSMLRYRAWTTAWKAFKAPTRISSRLGWPMGALAYSIDPVALRLFGGVSSKFLVLRRPIPK
jgi:SAM-dependent methyltransferase